MTEPLLSALALSGPDRGAVLATDTEIDDALRAPELAWLHMAADHPGTRAWLERHLDYLDPHALTALLAEETRPRAIPMDTGALVILRGVNTNPGADPEDMVSVRVWLDRARIVSLSRRPVTAVKALSERVRGGNGPDRTGAFLCELVEALGELIEDFLRELDDETDALERDVLEGPSPELRARITEARGQVADFRRHIASQRDALARLTHGEIEFLSEQDRRRLMEAHDRMIRTVEELDGMRERLLVVKDDLVNALSERLNRNIYLLSVVSAVFLPLAFLTGLFGINLAGIPGAENPSAFWVFSGVLLAVLVVQVAVLRFLRWF